MSGLAAGIGAQLPALQVVVPLLASGAALLLDRPRRAWAFASTVTVATFLVSVALLLRVMDEGVISYELGGWPPPWGIEYRVDAANAFVLLVVAGASALVILFARASVEREVPRSRVGVFYTAWLLCLTGLLGITITGDLFNVFVFLEISSLATYTLVALGPDRRALTAAFRYLIMGTIGATFILMGLGLMYGLTGTLNMADLAARLPEAGDTRTVRAAFAFLTIGVAIKMALFPLHAWLPNAYSYAPSAVTAFLAASATKVAVYLWVRVVFTIFGVEFSFDAMEVGRVLMAVSMVAIVAGSLAAIVQTDAKQLLAYSSVAQIGYMALGVSFATLTGMTAGMVHIFNHALMKAALFMALACIVYRTGSTTIESFAGLGRRMPWTFAAAVVAGLSLVGVPLTAGFISKWYLLSAALELGLWPVAVLIGATSLLAVIYVWRLLEGAYFREPAPGSVQAQALEVPAAMLVPLWVAAAANLWFGLHTVVPVGGAARAAAAFLGGGP